MTTAAHAGRARQHRLEELGVRSARDHDLRVAVGDDVLGLRDEVGDDVRYDDAAQPHDREVGDEQLRAVAQVHDDLRAGRDVERRAGPSPSRATASSNARNVNVSRAPSRSSNTSHSASGRSARFSSSSDPRWRRPTRSSISRPPGRRAGRPPRPCPRRARRSRGSCPSRAPRARSAPSRCPTITIGSPSSTRSPTSTYHSATVTSSIALPSCGTMTGTSCMAARC